MKRPRYESLAERLFANSVEEDGHWIWIGYRCKSGYGRISMKVQGKKKAALAHRVSYAVFVETIPEGFDIDHKCHVRACIHPNHLQKLPWKEHRAAAYPRFLRQCCGGQLSLFGGV